MRDYEMALPSAAREMKKVVRVKVDGPKNGDPDLDEILTKLAEHRAYYEDYYNGLIENDADYIRQREAQAHLNGIEECVNIVRRVIDGY